MNKDLAKIIPSHNRPVTAGNKKESIKRVSTPKEKIKIEKNNDKENPNLSKTLSKKENKNDLKISEIKQPTQTDYEQQAIIRHAFSN